MDVCTSMTLGKTTLMSSRLVVMAANVSIDMLGVSSSMRVPWLLYYCVDNRHNIRPIGEATKS